MEKRLQLKVQATKVDILMEWLGWLLLFGIWIMVFFNYKQLPDSIPTNYNGAGVADDFGSKLSIFSLPIVGTILFIGITVLSKYPHIFNYPTKITEENAHRQYTNATKLLKMFKLSLAIIFGLLVFITIQHALGRGQGLGTWFLPLMIVLILLPMIYFLINNLQEKHQK
jgi:uncharacterized membrane protein